jgi:hypothetical protein
VRDDVETSTGDRVATGWFVQGQQTLTARWFLAGRLERMSSPAVFWLGGSSEAPYVEEQHLRGGEATVGYRVTPELTLRAGHRARQGFGRPGYDNALMVSAVWWRRWL